MMQPDVKSTFPMQSIQEAVKREDTWRAGRRVSGVVNIGALFRWNTMSLVAVGGACGMRT